MLSAWCSTMTKFVALQVEFATFNSNIFFNLDILPRIFAMEILHYSIEKHWQHTKCSQITYNVLFCLSPIPTWSSLCHITAIYWQNARNKSYELDFHKFYLHNTQAFHFNILMYGMHTSPIRFFLCNFAILQKSSSKYVPHFVLFVYLLCGDSWEIRSFFISQQTQFN